MNNLKPVIRMRMWLENEDGEVIFGSGRSALIENIAEYGSLKKAAYEMRISYRAAWGKLKETENRLGDSLVEKAGANKEGYNLTELGKKLNDLYKVWFDRVEEFAKKEAEDIFPWDCLSYDESREDGPEK